MRGALLRVGVWNLRHALDPRTDRVDLGAVAAALAEIDADVVAVLEVDRELARSGGVHQVEELAAKLGRHGAFAPALLGDPAGRWTPAPETDPGGPAYGIGLLSRFALGGLRRTHLPLGARPRCDPEPRVLLRTAVHTPAGEVPVAAAHLAWTPWRAAGQLRRILDLSGPALLLGDLNLPLHLVRWMTRGTGWRTTRAGPTFPARYPTLQLDHVLARGGRTVDPQVGGPGPSDHLPLWCTVRLGRR